MGKILLCSPFSSSFKKKKGSLFHNLHICKIGNKKTTTNLENKKEKVGLQCETKLNKLEAIRL